MRRMLACALAVAVLSVPGLAQASILYPDVEADKLWFRNIVESSPTGDPLPLYGQPGANIDQLIFPTTGNFASSSLDGGPSDDTDGKLTLTLETKPGVTLGAFSIDEAGLVALDAPFGGDAFARVLAFVVVEVLEINNAPVNVPAFSTFLVASPLGGQFLLSDIGGSSFASGWSATVQVPLPENTTKVNLTIDNDLYAATTGDGTRALIDKKSFTITPLTIGEIVPEPATAALLASAGLLCILRRRQAD